LNEFPQLYALTPPLIATTDLCAPQVAATN